MKKTTPTLRILAFTAAALVAEAAGAAIVTNNWTGGLAPGNINWSGGDNWSLGGVDVTNVVLFNDAPAPLQGTIGPSGTPDSIVDTTQTIQGLYCHYTNTTSGKGHTIQINSGASLIITGLNYSIYVGNPVGTDNGKDATNYTTIRGTGSLCVTNPGTDIWVRQSSAADGKHYATFDLAGLDTFIAYLGRVRVGDSTGSGINTRCAGAMLLAKTNFIVADAGFKIAEAQSQNSTTVPQALYLGQTNVIFSDTGLTIARQKATGLVAFNKAMANPVAFFRDSAGTGRQSQWLIGAPVGGGSTGSSGTVDFSYGTVDALVDQMVIGRGQPTSGAVGRGVLSFTNGTIDVNSLDIGYQQSASTSIGNGAVNVDNGANLTVNGDVTLGVTSTALPSSGCLNIGTNVPGGSVWVKGNIIDGGGMTNFVRLIGGSLKVGGNVGSSALPLENLCITNGTITFDRNGYANPTQPLWYATNLAVSGTVTVKVEGTALGLGQFSLIKYTLGTIYGNGFPAFTLGSLPPRLSGYLSNNIAGSTIDLVITNVNAPKWNGNVAGGAWDIGSTANWLTISGGTATTYLQPVIPGDPVLFDDTATDTTGVNLTTVLSPAGVTVNNSAKDYTFTGTGGLGGPMALNKSGTRMLTIANTGSNTFAGGVTISGGLVRLSGTADRLPTNVVVAIADAADAGLDLNGVSQMIGSLSGGGNSGGNVSLGSGTLNITADGGVYSGVISGDGMVVKSGSGIQQFNQDNTYGGGTVVSGGTLVLANTGDSGLGSGSVTVRSNATLQIGLGGNEGSVSAATIMNDGWVILDRANDYTLTKLITGRGGLYKYGANTITIGTPNAFTNTTSIINGILRIRDSAALGTSPVYIGNGRTAALQLANSITLTQPISVAQKPAGYDEAPSIINEDGINVIAGPMTMVTGGTPWNIGSYGGKLVITGSFTPSGVVNALRLTLYGGGDGEWWSNIRDPLSGGGRVGVTKPGSGTWTFWGTNTYVGGTTVSAGSLIVNGALLGSTNILVDGGTLGGTGLITGPVFISGGTLSPGNSLGTMTINNALVFTNVAFLATTALFEVSDSGCDQVRGLTSVTYAGTLRVSVIGSLSTGKVFKLFDAASYGTTPFDVYDLPSLPTGLTWDTSQLTVDGTLRVIDEVTIGGITQTGDGNFTLTGSGPAGENYRAFATTNLADPLSWVQVNAGIFTGGVFTFPDLNATNYPQRFYRIVTP